MDLFELSAKLTMDSSEYESAIAEAGSKASSFGDKLGSGLATAGKVTAGVMATMTTAVVGLGTAFGNTISATAEYGDAIDKNSQKLGVSSTFYQEWEAVLQHSGTSMDSMSASFKKLATASQNASAQQEEAFKTLGLSMEQVSSMSAEELFSSVVSGLQGMEEGTERTALATTLLGKGAQELGPLLNTSAEDTQKMIDKVNELGGVMSEESIKASASFQDSLQDLQTSFSGLKNNLASDFLPAVTTVMDGLTQLMTGDSSGLNAINEGINNLVDGITSALPELMSAGASIVMNIGEAIIQNLPLLLETGMSVVMELGQGLIDNLPMILDVALQLILTLSTGIAENLPTLIPAIVDVVLQISMALVENADLLIDGAIALILGLTEGLINAMPTLIEKIPELVVKIVEAFITNAPKLLKAGLELITMIAKGLITYVPLLISKVPTIMTQLKNSFIDAVKSFVDIGKNIVEGIKDGFEQAWDGMVSKVTEKAQALVEKVKETFDIHSPSRVFKQIGQYCVEGYELGMQDFANGSILDGVVDTLNSMPTVSGLGYGTGQVYNQTINVNQQISTADELARKIRLESRYGLMVGAY